MTPVAYSTAASALLRAARRAHERGDIGERDRLLDEEDGQLVAMIDTLPDDRRPRG